MDKQDSSYQVITEVSGSATRQAAPTPYQSKLEDHGFQAHLVELRNRLLLSVGVLAVTVTLAFFISLDGINFLKTLAPEGVEFIQLSPGEVMFASFRLALYLGVAMASPVLLYQLLRFILPGLTKQERGWILISVVGGTVLFALGLVFAWQFVVPSALGYLLGFGQAVAISQISIERYISFCASLFLLCGILFELPLVLLGLSFTGLISSKQLIGEWRRAIIMIFVAAALLTPTQDPITLIIVSLAMVLLYVLSILPIRLIGR